MATPLEIPDSVSEPPLGGPGEAIQSRSLRQIAWMRLKRDRVALAGGAVVVFLILVAIFAPLLVAWLGHPPTQFQQELIDPDLQVPKGSFGGISGDNLLGVEPVNGRDLFSRGVYGSRIS